MFEYTLIKYSSIKGENMLKIENSVMPVNKNTIVLTDIPGGTTSNVALRLTQKYPWTILSGVNALMLVETIMHQNEDITAEIVKKILEAGQQSQKNLNLLFRSEG